MRWRLEALDEKELTSPRSPEVSDDPTAVLEEDVSVSHSWHSTIGSSVSLEEKRGHFKGDELARRKLHCRNIRHKQAENTFMKLKTAMQIESGLINGRQLLSPYRPVAVLHTKKSH